MNVLFSLQDCLVKAMTMTIRRLGGCRSSLGLLIVGGLLVALAQPVTAQSYQDQRPQAKEHLRREQTDPQPSPSSPSNLPDWAEPSQSQRGSVSGNNVDPKVAPPDPPGPPPQVPVDGGLALLAAAGAGYAVRKLNEEDEEDPVA